MGSSSATSLGLSKSHTWTWSNGSGFSATHPWLFFHPTISCPRHWQSNHWQNPTVLASLESESKWRLWWDIIHKQPGKHSVYFLAITGHLVFVCFEACPFGYFPLVCCVKYEPVNKMRSGLKVKIVLWVKLGKGFWESLSGIAWWSTLSFGCAEGVFDNSLWQPRHLECHWHSSSLALHKLGQLDLF